MPPATYVRLSADAVRSQLLGSKWRISNDTIQSRYIFKSFEDTWAFLQKVALRSHIQGHHPKITTIYNKVELELTTHDVNGLSDMDVKLAKRFEKYAKEIGEKDSI